MAWTDDASRTPRATATTPRRHLQPDHAGQGEAAELRDAAEVHLLPLGAAGGLGQPERLPDLRPARNGHRARAPPDHRPRPAPVREPAGRAAARLRGQHADRHRHRGLRAVRREPPEGDRGRHRHPLRHRGEAPVRRHPGRRCRRAAPRRWAFEQSKALWEHLKDAGYVDAKGKVQDTLRKALKDGTLHLPEAVPGPASAGARRSSASWPASWRSRTPTSARQVKTRQAVLHSEEFKALWDRIKHKTTYRVQFDNEKLIAELHPRPSHDAPPITKTRLQWRKADLAIGKAGVEATETATAAPVVLDESDIELPDLLTDLQDRTQLTRRSLVRILTGSGRLDDFKRNPQQFIELAAEVDQPHQAPGPGGRHQVPAARRRALLRPGAVRAGGADRLPEEHAGRDTSRSTSTSSTIRGVETHLRRADWRRTRR